MSEQAEAVLFDLDGVIVDTAEYHFQSWRELADEIGITTFTRERNELLKGVSRMRSLEILLDGAEYSDEEKAAMAERKNERYREAIQAIRRSDALPGAVETVSELRRRGIKTALASSSKNARTVIRLMEMEDWFDGIVDGTMIENSKPDPEVFLKAAKLCGAAPERCVVVEDAAAGIEAGLSGGMRTLGIGKPEGLPGAHRVVPDLSHITVDEILAL